MSSTNDVPSNRDFHRFSPEEVEAILRRAIERQQRLSAPGSLSRDELMATAGELGIDPGVVQDAIRDLETSRQVEKRQEFQVQHRRRYGGYLRRYILLSVVLIAVNATLGGIRWSIFVLFMVGVALLFSWVRNQRRLLQQGT